MLLNTLATTVATLALGGAATAAAVVGVNLDQAADDGPEDGLKVPCGTVWDRLPADLQDDLRALQAAEPADREELAKQIRRDALEGDYGRGVKRFAERRAEIRAEVWTRLPADLKADLKAARALPPEQRQSAYEAIRDDALAGEHGDRVQEVAQQLADRREACGDVTD
jgi:Spy/CpxP family protein refolding chaperone